VTKPFYAVIYNPGVNDIIDLKDLAFNESTTYSTSFANDKTTLVVSNSEHSVTLTVAGDHPNWTLSLDDSGIGTKLVDPPAADAPATTVAGSTSTDLASTVTAALTTQDGSADQFTFQSDSQSGTLASESTVVASANDPSATDAASASSGHTSATAAVTTVVDASATTNTQLATNDSTQTNTTTQTAHASPAATNAPGDTFVFAANFGHKTIANFHPDTDAIEIDHTVFADFQALLAATHDDGHGNAVIAANPHDSITVKIITVAQLVQHQSDFHFT